ncbi:MULTISPECIES: hypothetical protein [unclassified Pseudomonas]|uniref:hypothetical protein n=1 Tax=unclassified Pseudomonas TaxID=196821 RepID=UPI001B318DD1|nr:MULTISPECIES: hypothetical protein [unclassified Pseudomonas]MBP5947375.1 hypothetical protein [Pseudomonas sp. P9(2020)]MBZ9565528.1 hypothetical protein [Pseudomonas sp. P116]
MPEIQHSPVGAAEGCDLLLLDQKIAAFGSSYIGYQVITDGSVDWQEYGHKKAPRRVLLFKRSANH